MPALSCVYMYLALITCCHIHVYRNKSVVKTNCVVILLSIEKWMVNRWKDGPLDAGIRVCK